MTRDGFKRPNLSKEGPKDLLVPRIDWKWFQESQLGQRRFEG